MAGLVIMICCVSNACRSFLRCSYSQASEWARRSRLLALCIPLVVSLGHNPSCNAEQWTVRDAGKQDPQSGKKPSLRGLAAIDADSAWACGSMGTILRINGDASPVSLFTIPGLESSEFRSIHAWNAEECIVATAGQPATVWKTTDGGKAWKCVLRSDNEKSFFNGMAFYTENHGVLFGDPIDRKLEIYSTSDRGESWQKINPSRLPTMDDNEAGFAASNSSMLVARVVDAAGPAERDAILQKASARFQLWIGLGGRQGTARVLKSDTFEVSSGMNDERRWTLTDVAVMRSSPSEGIFSLAMNDRCIVAVGGDYQVLGKGDANIAVIQEPEKSWRVPMGSRPRGFRSSVLYATQQKMWFATGPSGTDSSVDGENWKPHSDTGFHVLDVGRDGTIWAAGSDGRLGKLIHSPH